MPVRHSGFPEEVWSGKGPRRLSRQEYSAPSPEDHDQLIAEILAIQDSLREQFQLREAQIQFMGEAFEPDPGVTTFDVPVEVTDGSGFRNIYTTIVEVTVTILSGTGTLGNGEQTQVLKLVKGQAIVTVSVVTANTVQLGLVDSAGSGLSVDNVVDVPFTE